MSIDLYYTSTSPPCRAVLLTAKTLSVDLKLKPVNLFAKGQMNPKFLAINPQHTVPTMVDGHVTLSESRAICCYLASQYGKDDSLYPSNPKARCKVDERLYFDMGTLYARWLDYVVSMMEGSAPDPFKLEPIKEALGWLNDHLSLYPWVAGETMTVADFAIVASVTSIEASGVIEFSGYTRLQRWLQRCQKKMKGFHENKDGAMSYGDFVKAIINANTMDKKGDAYKSD